MAALARRVGRGRQDARAEAAGRRSPGTRRRRRAGELGRRREGSSWLLLLAGDGWGRGVGETLGRRRLGGGAQARGGGGALVSKLGSSGGGARGPRGCCCSPATAGSAGFLRAGGGGVYAENATSAPDRRAPPVRYTVNTCLYAI
nr:DEAD-box ATP-dependent RNA helicase 9-like [Aegilops tauschii subsp. strangulata]